MKIITKNGYFEQSINKSRFIGFAYFVDSEEDAQKLIKQIQNKYYDCRHVVYAYKIEPNIEKKGNSSEPAGTAGAPILSAIEKNELTNVLVVIVRYFGGVLLGASNLYRAYSSTALNALQNAELKEMELYYACYILCDYAIYNQILSLSKKYSDIKILKTFFGDKIDIKIAYKDISKYDFIDKIIKTQNAKVESVWL